MPEHTCLRCQKTWTSPVDHPKACARCRSALWDVARVRAYGGGRRKGEKRADHGGNFGGIRQDRGNVDRVDPVQRPTTFQQEVRSVARQIMDQDPEIDRERAGQQTVLIVKQRIRERELAAGQEPDLLGTVPEASAPDFSPLGWESPGSIDKPALSPADLLKSGLLKPASQIRPLEVESDDPWGGR